MVLKMSKVTPFFTSKARNKHLNQHEQYISRITKTLCYGKIPHRNFTPLPVIELATELFSNAREELTLDYLDVGDAARLCRRVRIPPHTLVLALIYLDRLKASNPKYVSKVSPSEIFLVSMMIGSKFAEEPGREDSVYNDFWSFGSGLDVKDVNRAEREFLDAINWNVFVKNEEFWQKFYDLEKKVSLRQAFRRGWVSYTEMNLLLNPQSLKYILSFLHMSWICLVSYTVSVVTVLGSAILVSQVVADFNRPVPILPQSPVVVNQSDLSQTFTTVSEPIVNGFKDCNRSFGALFIKTKCDNMCYQLNTFKDEFDHENWDEVWKSVVRENLNRVIHSM